MLTQRSSSLGRAGCAAPDSRTVPCSAHRLSLPCLWLKLREHATRDGLPRVLTLQCKRQAVAEAQQREAAAAAARNPWSAFGRRPGGPAPGGAGGRRGGPAKQEGPVIDAEWTTIDDDM